MNECFKAMAQEGYDLFKTGEAVVAKSSLAVIFPLLIKDGMDAAAIEANISSLKSEAQALVADPAADADLLAFVSGLVGGESAKAAAVVSAVGNAALHVVSDIEAVKAAFAG